jgi:hypothetical protein
MVYNLYYRYNTLLPSSYFSPNIVMTEPVFRLIPATKSYPWGKKGSSSLAAQLAEGAGIPEFKIDESKHYAEVHIICKQFMSVS